MTDNVTKLIKAAQNLLNWHEKELPKFDDFIVSNLVRLGRTELEGTKTCEVEVTNLASALRDIRQERKAIKYRNRLIKMQKQMEAETWVALRSADEESL